MLYAGTVTQSPLPEWNKNIFFFWLEIQSPLVTVYLGMIGGPQSYSPTSVSRLAFDNACTLTVFVQNIDS